MESDALSQDIDLGIVKQEVEAEELSQCPTLSLKDDAVKKEYGEDVDDHFLDAVKLEKLEPPYVIVNRKDNILLAVNR